MNRMRAHAELARSRTPYSSCWASPPTQRSAATRRAPSIGGEGLRRRGTDRRRDCIGRGLCQPMIDLAPTTPRASSACAQVIGELEAVPDTFYDRNDASSSAWRKTRRLEQGQPAPGLVAAHQGTACERMRSTAGKRPRKGACDGVWNPRRRRPPDRGADAFGVGAIDLTKPEPTTISASSLTCPRVAALPSL